MLWRRERQQKGYGRRFYIHSEIKSFGEPGLLVLLLQEEKDTGPTFGKETHHLLSLAREATRTNPQGFVHSTIILSNSPNRPQRNTTMSLHPLFLNGSFPAELTWKAQHGMRLRNDRCCSAVLCSLFMFNSVKRIWSKSDGKRKNIQLTSYKC